MTTRMLIDARHPEETRVAVVKGNRIDEFDFESAEHKQLKGNIYLAKVTRVEPSLQAAFIDYGGNRHGFLAFSEIHPDYYQIPKADRDALLQEEAEHAAEEERLRALEDARHDDPDDDFTHEEDDEGFEPEPVEDVGVGGGQDEAEADENGVDENGSEENGGEVDAVEEVGEEGLDDGHLDDMPAARPEPSAVRPEENAADELRRKRQNLRRRYKIQDVIHRRQVLLVQVVKEERGNKGAALTTYLSLAGRYCVLMPNTNSGGGISRKISNGADRKRLKSIMADLNLPKTMGCIVRTAGLSRTKTEIKRDFDYLARLWDEVREKTLGSSAPALIYGDSDLVKRAIRDIYNREIDEVIVEGEDGYRHARAYMKLLMPSHVKRVAAYQDSVPLFQRYGVEDQLSGMYQPLVQLKSGGYLVINPTEALVSIDINSGRSTREHNIEQTAYATNIEAAHEIARQLRLRDMAGLVVIDFIDMESNGHIRKVERAMKDALANDRARIQVGRISGFGLMEMSRQRLRTGVLEASTKPCEHCDGSGLMRTASSAGLSALRMLEEEAARGRGDRIQLRAGREAAIYVLNRKRREIGEVEERYGVSIEIVIDPSFEGARMTVESAGQPPVAPRPLPAPILIEEDEEEDMLDLDEDEDEEDEERSQEARPRGEGEREGEEGRKRRRRRRGGRGARREEEDEAPRAAEQDEVEAEGGDEADDAPAPRATGEEGDEDRPRRRGRRGRRSGRRRPGEGEGEIRSADGAEPGDPDDQPDGELEAEPLLPEIAPEMAEAGPLEVDGPLPDAEPVTAPETEAESEEATPRARRRPRARKAKDPVADAVVDAGEAPSVQPAEPELPELEVAAAPEPANDINGRAKPKPPARTKEVKAASGDLGDGPAGEPLDGPAGEPRRGWWQRTFG